MDTVLRRVLFALVFVVPVLPGRARADMWVRVDAQRFDAAIESLTEEMALVEGLASDDCFRTACQVLRVRFPELRKTLEEARQALSRGRMADGSALLERGSLKRSLGKTLTFTTKSIGGLSACKRVNPTCKEIVAHLKGLRQDLKALRAELTAAPAAEPPSGDTSIAVTAGPAGAQVDVGAGAALGVSVTTAETATETTTSVQSGGATVGMQMHVAPLAGGAAVTTTATEVEAVDAAPAAGAEPAAGAYGMPPADFERLLAAIRDEDFADGKRRVVEDSAESWTFTCKQVASILELFTFGDDKLAALRVLAPRLVDPENAYTIYRVFEFDSDKDEARSILRSAR